MRLFKCDTQQINLTIIEIPRQSWKVLPPKKWQVIILLAGIVLTAVLWGVL